ncbi:MAG: trimethylamine methyltransferase family protein [Candidatus Lokiarchaeota archaeon]
MSVLDEKHKENIFNEAKEILSSQGVFIENKEAKLLLKKEGLKEENSKFLIPGDLIEKCLDSVPETITLYDREGNENGTLGYDNVYYDPGSAAILILDEKSGQIREAFSDDFIRFSKIVDHLGNIEVQSTALVYQDIPKEAQDWHRLFIALSYCHKPVVTGTFRKKSFKIMKDLLLACRNSEEDLANKPLAIFDACPSPPLKWSDLTTQSVIDAAKSMIPSEFISMPLSGANAPITLIGSITQHCAESLAGVVIAQLARKRAPLIWGGSPAVLDMKNGTTPMGSIETMMVNIGNIEMGKFFNLPTHAYMGLSDSKLPDAQGGLESGMGSLLAALIGVNMVSGAGMLDFESTQSIEKLLIDNEIIGMAKRFIEGIKDYGQPYALEILKDYDSTQELLSHPTTLSLFKKEIYFPSNVINRMTRDKWRTSGEKSARENAKELMNIILNKAPVETLDTQVKKRLDKIASENLEK